jgi:hypothetical protein
MDDDEIKKLRADIVKRLEGLGRNEPMSKAGMEKQIAEARAWLSIMEESQKTRAKFGQQLASDFQVELGNDAAAARNKIGDLENEVYGGYLASLRTRLDNAERAFQETQRGGQQ